MGHSRGFRFVSTGIAIALSLLAAACGKPSEPSARSSPAVPVARVSVRTDTTRDLGTEVQLRDVVLDRSGELMTVWIYSPRKPAAPAKRPVILIAAAGSPLIWGMALSER